MNLYLYLNHVDEIQMFCTLNATVERVTLSVLIILVYIVLLTDIFVWICINNVKVPSV